MSPQLITGIFAGAVTLFVAVIGWFISLLYKFSKNIKDLEKSFFRHLAKIENRVSKLETGQAVDNERYRNIEKIMTEFKEDFKCFKDEIRSMFGGKQ